MGDIQNAFPTVAVTHSFTCPNDDGTTDESYEQAPAVGGVTAKTKN